MMIDATARERTARSAAANLRRLESGRPRKALVGFDGFIDSIIDVVDTRHSPETYTRIPTITDFSARAAAAAGRSTNMELVIREERFGGNGPLMAGALARLSMPTTFIGAIGGDSGGIHPAFEEFASRCERVIPLCPPARTDALEFDDGKIMFNKPANVSGVDWRLLASRVAEPEFRQLCGDASLIGMVNWVMTGGEESIWRELIHRVFPSLPPKPARRVFIDLSDPAKRTDSDIARALDLIGKMSKVLPVTLGLNLAESERIAAVCGAKFTADISATSASIRERLELDCVVVHPRDGAGASTSSGEGAWFDGPFTTAPRLSTGAGDHFNAGFAFAQVHGLPLAECLAVGCAESGAYVRDASSPTLPRLIEFLENLPRHEQA